MTIFVKNLEFKVIAYPNPYTENYNLSLTNTSIDKVVVIVYDMIGKFIEKHEVKKYGKTLDAQNANDGVNIWHGIAI